MGRKPRVTLADAAAIAAAAAAAISETDLCGAGAPVALSGGGDCDGAACDDAAGDDAAGGGVGCDDAD